MINHSTFVARVPAPTETDPMSDAPDLVLLVDDEKSILDVLSMGFKKAGIPVKTAINAEEIGRASCRERVCLAV